MGGQNKQREYPWFRKKAGGEQLQQSYTCEPCSAYRFSLYTRLLLPSIYSSRAEVQESDLFPLKFIFMTCPSVGGPFHGVQSFRNRLLQCGSPRSHKPCQYACSGMGFSLHGSAGRGRSLLQHRLPMGSQIPSGIHLLWHGVPSTGYRWRSAPPWTSMGCRGTICLTMVFITSCKGRLSPPVS